MCIKNRDPEQLIWPFTSCCTAHPWVMHAVTAHLPVTQLQPRFNGSGPLHESGFVPRWAHPRSPSQALSPPAGVLHNESLWIRSTSANPSANFLTVMFVYRGIAALLGMFFEAVARVCVPACESLYNIWMWGSVDPGLEASDWRDPSSDVNCDCVCLNGCVRSWCGESTSLGTDLVDL